MSRLLQIKYKKLGLFKIIILGYSLYFKKFIFFTTQFLILFYLPQKLLWEFESFTHIFISNYYIFDLFWKLYFHIVAPVISCAFITIITKEIVLDRKIRFKPILEKVIFNFLTLIYLNFIFYLKTFMGLLLLIIPGILYSLSNLYFAQALLLSKQRKKEVFNYSKTITDKNQLRIFLFVILGLIQFQGVAFITQLPHALIFTSYDLTAIQSITQSSNKVVQWLLLNSNILLFIFTGLLGNIFIIADTLLFLNLEYVNLLNKTE